MISRKKGLLYAFLFIAVGVLLILYAQLMMLNENYKATLSVVGLTYFFSGFTFLSAHLENTKRKKVANNILIVALSLIVIGIILKTLQLPGAGLVWLIGFFLLACTYVPIIGAIRANKWKSITSKKWHSIILGFGDIAGLGALIIGVLGKMLHWPYMDVVLIAGAVSLLISLFSWNQVFSREVSLRKTAEEKLTQAFGELKVQHTIIEEKNTEILDSINYAKRIQYTLLAHESFLKENLSDHFTYFNPKDIVSGDFYWATKHNDKFYLAVCDSTGHGVPGAFMSLLNIGFLTEAINEKGIEKPNEVLDYVRLKLTHTISKEGQKDGFDGILVCFDQKKNLITYAAANNAPILIQNAQLIELDADRMPVGVGERKENFKMHTIEARAGDVLYLYTDGYADQFGGPRGKKFKYKQLNEILLTHHTKSLNEQSQILQKEFENWRGNLEQIDDVCVIGIRLR